MNETAAPPAVLACWLAVSTDLLALTGPGGRIAWANAAFVEATGLGGGDRLQPVLDDAGSGVVERGVAGAVLVDVPLRLLPPDGGAPRRLRVRTAAGEDGDTLWVMQDVTAAHDLAERERTQTERLEVAQEFGRLGVWERRIPSGEGSWDRHVFAFWGLDPNGPTPHVDEALQHIHPDDRPDVGYHESTRGPGRHSRHYRVVRPDGTVRRIHSQWEIKLSAEGVPDRAVGIMVDDTDAYELARSREAATTLQRLTVDLAGIVHWRHDLATGLVHYNPNGFAVLGMTPRPHGVPIEEVRALTHPDDLPRVIASAQRAVTSGLPDDAEARYLHIDGSWRNLLMRRLVQRSADGTPTGFIGVSLDITEQLERLRAADELARRLDSVADAAGIGIWSREPLTGVGHWNRQMFEMTGRPLEAVVPTFDEWLEQMVHPADRERLRGVPAALRRAPNETVRVEYRVVRPDGQTRWLEDRIRLDERNGRALVVGIKVDITERRAAADALRSADERAALAARSAGIGTWEVDYDAALQVESERWDAQMFRLRGLPPRDRPPALAERLALVQAEDRALTVDLLAGRGAADGPLSYEFRIVLPDGQTRWLASRSIAVTFGPQGARRRVGVNWDVTESKDAETARQEQALAMRENRAKSQFLSRMSHELRTPLNAVLGFTELLHLDASRARATDQLTKLGHIRSAGEHLLALINDVLDLSSLESGQLRLDAQPVELAPLAAQTVALVEPLLHRHGVELHCGRLDAVVIGDSRRLRQVLINLLSNAIKYNRRGGQVVLDAVVDDAGGAGSDGASGTTVTLRVRDDGRGLTDEQLAHLFEPFNRLGVEREGIEGSGIGLVIVKALTEGMGGRVSASSRPGRGTVFELTLPGHAAGPPLPPAAEPAGTPAATPAVELHGQLLYIEDNPVNVLLVEDLVSRHAGLALASEVTGGAGVARARALQPDLVLVDMQLPDFDGYEVLRRLRADPATAGLRCLALSANAMADDIDRALAAGFLSYWTKPIDFTGFVGALQTLLRTTPSAVAGGEPAN